MRLNFSTSWIFRGWIVCLFFGFYAQNVVSKSVQCGKKQYLRGTKCCDKCGPGLRVFSDCSDKKLTICQSCDRGEYQPGWTDEMRCLQQKFCDTGKGFMVRPENLKAEEPCRCLPNLQCSPINCEYCERIPTCSAGFGLEMDPELTNGRKICVPCQKGFYSADTSAEPCKPWTNCKAEGRSETRPGSVQADAVCGPPVSTGAAPPWVIVSVLSVITVLCLLILLLFCYKDKLKLLSVNLRSCVQNLKRTRIQQETLAPLYHSGGAGGGPGSPKCKPCETTVICQAPCSLSDDSSSTYPTSVPHVKVSLPFTAEVMDKDAPKKKTSVEDKKNGAEEPDEKKEETVSVSPLLTGSCVCVVPVREPLEVGENEDCSQAVSPGTLGTCFCGGLDGEKDGNKRAEEEKNQSEREGSAGTSRDKEKTISTERETGAERLICLSPAPRHNSSVITPSSTVPECCLPLSQAQPNLEFKPHLTNRSLIKHEELYSRTKIDSTSTEDTITTSSMTSFRQLMTSSSVGDQYLEKIPETSSQEQNQELCWGNASEKISSSGDAELECPPESLQSQLTEAALTSGQVTGNHNTTFISSGQVMNFSGEVIVVYVSQTSLSSDGAGLDDAFGSPVQEQADETVPLFHSGLRSSGDSISHNTLQDATLPVQEVMEEQLQAK
ncbi:tumor necrosis factor receptor superfamily member 11A [Thalassophryne amazonica]|uniref:tumor necrosis factor receptor superfamily member 11A n=1 Tax=Thalassophryne amazonica TaxID=390379 RepID=UPI001470B148|nr:tumor necrosis factor receptor superfamily member 11A [Thalassophryne amazonica]